MRIHRWLTGALLPVLGTTLLFAGEARAALNELTVYGIANFGGTSSCGTPEMTHSVHVTTASTFKSIFDLLVPGGSWDVARGAYNGSAKGTLWTDATQSMPCSGCTAEDSTSWGVDAADVMYVHTHGDHSSAQSFLWMGSAYYGCTVGTASNMLFNSDLEVAVIKACQSGDYNVWANGGYYQLVTSDSVFSMWNAFHGDSSCGDHVTDYVSDYSVGSLNDGMGENWLDAAYDYNGNNDDDCPVSITFGSTAASRENQYRYGGWIDRKSTGTKTGSTIFYMSGCNPYNGVTLPE
ncbi:MAG: hypothetical protein IT372_34660 [Polyangiaceae bacterium]|nr:hypothetical protein [Polyangiaceae bacterium]